jgi:outer membrane protein assembly factor BamB
MRRVVTWAALVAVAIGASGCWPAPGAGPDRRAHNGIESAYDAGTVADLEVAWSATVDATDPRGVGHPVLSGGGLVHVTTSRAVYAFAGGTGQSRWTSVPDASTPTFAEVDTDAVVQDDLLLTSVRLSGHRWEAVQCAAATGGCDTLGGEVPARLDAVRSKPPGFVVLLSRFADAAGGGVVQLAWPFFGGGPEVEVTRQPNDSRLTLGATQMFHAGIGAGTAPANGVRAFPVQGGPSWATPIDGSDATSPVLSADGTTVYVGTDAGTLYALATADGAVLWSAPVGSAVTAPPALDGETLFVPTAAGVLAAVPATGCGAKTCAPAWTTTAAAGPLAVQPAVAAGVVFTGSDDGGVRAYDAAGCGASPSPVCEPLWSDDTGSPITGAPAPSRGHLYVGTRDGRLIAYAR